MKVDDVMMTLHLHEIANICFALTGLRMFKSIYALTSTKPVNVQIRSLVR